MFYDKIVPIDSLYLDPNNPRLAMKIEISDDIVDAEIESAQPELQKRFVDGATKKHEIDIEFLLDSIAEIGYQGIDQIVVRPIQKGRSKFVVLEGNRRLASIKHLLEKDKTKTVLAKRGEHGRLRKKVEKTLRKISVLVLETKDVSKQEIQQRINLILGIRHHGSLLDWEPLPKAFNIFTEYMHKLSINKNKDIETNHKNFELEGPIRKAVANSLAVKPREVEQYLRSYIAYCQLRDSGFSVKPKHFSLIQELVCNSQLRIHFLPSDKKNLSLEQQSLDNIDKVAEFSERDKEGAKKILDKPQSVKKLKDLVCAQYDSKNSKTIRDMARDNLVKVVETKEMTLDEAVMDIIAHKKREGWIQAVENELAKLNREKQPLEYESYLGFGNERDAKDRLWKKVKKLQALVDVGE